MSNFEIKNIPLELVEIPQIYSLWDLSKKSGNRFGSAIFQYYKNADPNVFDKKQTRKNLYDTRKWYYYYKLETILNLSKTWNQNQTWQGAIIVEKSYIDARGKQRYVVHDGTHRFSVMRSYKVENYEFLLVNDRKSVTVEDLDEIKKFYKQGFKDTISIHLNKKDKMPMIQPIQSNVSNEYTMIKQWVASKLNFWDFVKL